MYESALWRENPFFTTTSATQLGRGKPVGGGVRRYRKDGDGLSNGAYEHTGISEMDWVTVWQANPFVTTMATQLGRGLSYSGCKDTQGRWRQTWRRGCMAIRGGGDGLSDWGYIFGSPRGR